MTYAYFNQKRNVAMPNLPHKEPVIHVVVGASMEKGFECAEIFEYFMDSNKFINEISKISNLDSAVLFVNNARWHISDVRLKFIQKN
jgi:hypothetical protein